MTKNITLKQFFLAVELELSLDLETASCKYIQLEL